MASFTKLPHLMKTFQTVSSVTFGHGERAITVEFRDADEFTPRGWHAVNSQGKDITFLAENCDFSEFERFLRDHSVQANERAGEQPDATGMVEPRADTHFEGLGPG